VTIYTGQDAPPAKSTAITSEIPKNADTIINNYTLAGARSPIMDNVTTETLPTNISMIDAHTYTSTALDTPAYKRKNDQVPVDVKEVSRSHQNCCYKCRL
jgi:hypothetical protein